MGSIAAMAASHRVKAGKRYVFFQSLQNYDSWWYPRLWAQGQNYLNSAKNQLKPDINSDDLNGLKKIEDYINYIKELADNEEKNEINFINTFKNILNKLENCDLKNKMFEFIDSLSNGNVSNYHKYLSIINEIMINNQDFIRKRQAIARESMGFVDEIYQGAEETLQEQIKNALAEENYGEYQKLIRSTYPKNQDNMIHHFSGTISSKFADKFNSIIRQIADDSNLLNILIQAWIKAPQTGINLNNVKMYIAATIAEYLKKFSFEDLKNIDVKTIIKNLKTNLETNPQFLTNLINTISDEYATNLWNLLESKKVVEKTLEEIALTTRRGLGNQFLRLDQTSQSSVIQMYSKYGFDQSTFDKIIKIQDSKKQSALITEKLGKAIRARAKKEWGIIVQDKYSKEQRKVIEEALKDKTSFQAFQQTLQRRVNPQNLKNQLQIKMKGPASAEAMAADIVKNLSPKDISILIGGGQIKQKSDVSWTYTGNLDFSEIIEDSSLAENIKQITSHFHENFIKRNFAAMGDQVITEVKISNFKAEMDSIRTKTKEQLKQFYSGDQLDQKISQVLTELNNLIAGGIQVKEYTHGGNLGFMGESLGANGEKILKNIDQMYAIGGISKIDYELLYFVLANCGEDAIASELKQDLAHYLLGGAMMILFDEGFTASQNFLNNMKQEFGFAPSIVHLFNLQGGHFVPASFVYNSIYNNLLSAYSDIASNIDIKNINTGNVTNEIHIINNITEKDKPDWKIMPKAQDRWDTVASKATDSKNIDIKITFLAGILDMFEAIPKAFDI